MLSILLYLEKLSKKNPSDTILNGPPYKKMRSTSLNLTSSSTSGQTSKRLIIKNLKGFLFL